MLDKEFATFDEMSEYIKKLYNLAYHDQLTGVYNRNKLEELREYFDKTQCTVVMVDINYLKTYNDTFGHESGDSIIRAVANELHWKFKNVYRLGGDEFLIVTEHIGGISEALDDISTKCFSIAYGLYIKPSMQPLAVAMKIADERMYQDKHDKKMRANRIL